MHRARKRSVALAIALAGWGSTAHAFHAGNVFDKPAGAGGGAGLFYAGAEHGWTCAACHVGATGEIRVSLTADPPDLLQTFRYEPGRTYTLKATLEGEHRGAGASNFNSLVVQILASDGSPAGQISGYAPDEMYNGGPTTIASAGQQPGRNAWSFAWTAPDAGRVTLHLAAVDGDGAGGEGEGTLTDPWNDDVFAGSLGFDAAGEAAREQGHDARAAIVAGAVLLGFRRRRGGRT
jgi:hypothetical protein